MTNGINTPNTHLGDVHWYVDMFFGTRLWVCQGLLGLRSPGETDEDFLDIKKHSVSDLWDFFIEVELPNGMLGLEVFSSDWNVLELCVIETTFHYDTDEISDQDLFNLIEDFKRHVRELPLATPDEGRLITDSNDPKYYEESNQRWLKDVSELNAALGAAYEVASKRLHGEGIATRTSSTTTDDDDIPF